MRREIHATFLSDVAGAYNPRHTMKWFHVDPDEAVKIHQDINSKRSLAVHWATFREISDSRIFDS